MAVTTTETGRRGEMLALKYLKKQGMTVLAKNYRAGHLEIDLVLLDGEVTVFVEVKARSRTDYGMPAEYVTRQKRDRLARAALFFLSENGLNDSMCRFDVVEVYFPEENVRHIRDAFRCDSAR